MPDLQNLPACQRGRDLPRAASKGARACLRKRSHEDQLSDDAEYPMAKAGLTILPCGRLPARTRSPGWADVKASSCAAKPPYVLADSERYTYNSGPIPAR